MPDYYIGCSTDKDIRFKSSSGGVGTTIIKFLLSQPDYGTSMTFVFNSDQCVYEPRLIYSFDEYNNCGSVYQDTDTIGFIKDNLERIKGGIVVTCMPCQVRAIRSILDSHSINSFIISLCCSGQTTKEGTWLYYKYLGISKDDVARLQYRGNGWPSGIQITLKDGSVIKKDNWTYPWTIIHQSLLFRPRRCLFCTYKTVPYSDVNLADPWLKEYEDNDIIGNSCVIVNSDKGKNVFDALLSQNLVCCKKIEESTYVKSQKGTIEGKSKIGERKRFFQFIAKLSTSDIYKKIVTYSPKTLKRHNLFVSKISLLLR